MTLNRKEILARFQSVIALALMIVVLSLLSSKFLTVDNARNILLQISVNLCVSIGMTLIILTGGIDLSVGSILALTGAIAAGLLKLGVDLPRLGVHLQFTPVGAMIAAVVVGMALGWHNAIFITRFRLPPFISTLAMLIIARGLTYLWTGGFPVTNLGASFNFIGSGTWPGGWLPVPMPIWICVGLVVLFHLISHHTTLGRYTYAIGGSERAARFSGINTDRIKVLVYMLGGALAAVGGLIVTARLDAADPKAGTGYELDSIAAVVIGGASLSGGRGTILGTVLGCLIIGVLNNGLFLLDVSPFWQLVIKGYVILTAAAMDKAGTQKN